VGRTEPIQEKFGITNTYCLISANSFCAWRSISLTPTPFRL
jgi:hypothetical protein